MKGLQMVGRNYICREGQIFACRLPATSNDKYFIFKCDLLDKRIENPNNTWTHFDLRQFTTNSFISLEVGEYTAVQGFPPLGFIYLENIGQTSGINIKIDNLIKTGTSIAEPIIYEGAVNAKRNYDINFNGALSLITSTADKAEQNSRSVCKFRGYIPAHINSINAITFTSKTEHVLFDLDYGVDVGATNTNGANFTGSINTVVTGKIVHNTGTHPALIAGINDANLTYATLKNLILKTSAAFASIRKSGGVSPMVIRVLGVYSNNAVDAATNGGITQTVDATGVIVHTTV